MGYTQAYEMAGLVSREVGLEWHLTSNHYPPLPVGLVPYCSQAIDAVAAGRPDEEIVFPNGKTVTAGMIVDSANLKAWVEKAQADAMGRIGGVL